MSSGLLPSSRISLRRCRIRRFYSSEASENVQAQRAPRASEFGGIAIGPTPKSFRGTRISRKDFIPIFSPNTSAVSVSEFRKGSVAQRLARREVEREKAKENTSTMTPDPLPNASADREREQEQAPRQDSRIEDGEKHAERPPQVRRRRLQAQGLEKSATNQSNRPDGERQRRTPDQPKPDLMQTKREVRRGSGSAPQRRRRRSREEIARDEEDDDLDLDLAEDDEAVFDTNSAVATSFRLRRPDPPLRPRAPTLSQPLRALEMRFDIDRNLQGLPELVGGDYARRFSPEQWRSIRSQSSGPLGTVDYAKLALSLNKSVDVEGKRLGLHLVKKHIGKAAVTATAP